MIYPAMAANKRKLADRGKEVSSKPTSAATAPPAKRLRKEERNTKSATNTALPTKVEDSAERNLPRASLLKDDERAFPRGGGGVLNPLEQKQIQVQAARDVLFDDSRVQRSAKGTESEDGEKNEKDDLRSIKKKKKQRKQPQSGRTPREDHGEHRIRVDGLKQKVRSCMTLDLL